MAWSELLHLTSSNINTRNASPSNTSKISSMRCRTLGASLVEPDSQSLHESVHGLRQPIGALVNIIDAASKVISTIHNLQAQWKDAHVAVLILASQLSAFFLAALRRIQEWLDSEVPAAHHQLVTDVDETLTFCNILIIKIEVLSAGWEALLEDPEAITGRWKVTVGNKGLDNILVLVEYIGLINASFSRRNRHPEHYNRSTKDHHGSTFRVRAAVAH